MQTITCPVMQAARILECQFVESLFFRAALEAGFGHGSETRARELHETFKRGGFIGLPTFAQNFIIKVNKGLVTLKGDDHRSAPRKAS